MIVASFVMVMLVFAYVCYLGFRGYFFVAVTVRRHVSHDAVRTGLLFVWFLAFVAIEMPVAVFFPLWLGERWNVFDDGQMSRAALILFGCASLAIAVWFGMKSK
ncbi:MAG: hypothetical protein SXG53_23140, partial [Pseudomonadota bacterium]|nr:hypothetical protein [Pseudomonadota bacterium]